MATPQPQPASPRLERHLADLDDSVRGVDALLYLRKYMGSMDLDKVPSFLQQLEDRPSIEGAPRQHLASLELIEDLARQHGPAVSPHVPKLMTSLLRKLASPSSTPKDQEATAGAVVRLAEEAAGGDAAHGAAVMVDICKPLAASLNSSTKGAGSARCLRALTLSSTWPMTSGDIVEEVLNATIYALEAPNMRVEQLQLALALTDASPPHLLQKYRTRLLDAAEAMLGWEGVPELRIHAIKLLEAVLADSEEGSFRQEVEARCKPLSLVAKDERVPEVQKAAVEALQTLRELQTNWKPRGERMGQAWQIPPEDAPSASPPADRAATTGREEVEKTQCCNLGGGTNEDAQHPELEGAVSRHHSSSAKGALGCEEGTGQPSGAGSEQHTSTSSATLDKPNPRDEDGTWSPGTREHLREADEEHVKAIQEPLARRLPEASQVEDVSGLTDLISSPSFSGLAEEAWPEEACTPPSVKSKNVSPSIDNALEAETPRELLRMLQSGTPDQTDENFTRPQTGTAEAAGSGYATGVPTFDLGDKVGDGAGDANAVDPIKTVRVKNTKAAKESGGQVEDEFLPLSSPPRSAQMGREQTPSFATLLEDEEAVEQRAAAWLNEVAEDDDAEVPKTVVGRLLRGMEAVLSCFIAAALLVPVSMLVAAVARSMQHQPLHIPVPT
eukprot:SM000010S04217  [mRNA]  locus=s10:344050:347645:+ [translate_table: standard]